MMGNKWEDNGDRMGNDGIGMGNTQNVTEFYLGFCSFHEVEKAGKNWIVKAIAKKCRKNKKTLCSTEIVCYTRSLFFHF